LYRESGVIGNRPDLMSEHISGSSTRTGDAIWALPAAARKNPQYAELPRGSDQVIAMETGADRPSPVDKGPKRSSLNSLPPEACRRLVKMRRIAWLSDRSIS
jgi:hypothetical protein